jgi:hypothetical protein
MRPLFRRIALNGLVTAVILAGMGFAYAEIASMWLASAPVSRAEGSLASAPSNDAEALRDSLRVRVPLAMAACGLIFITVAEVVLYWWRGNPIAVAKKPITPQVDPAEKLLEELLAQAEAAKKPVSSSASSS